ncbi:hypothetical protein VOLCADRAFT_87995 [Volvox carteri f. nagariensis]|uniref:Uncharacterized protein n=1 Tax=Volvox carteri f. nagariensis TaxID=3068 RepID=D8TMT1_VOLCA|nr:uncharacterized protein VOLCADRAFT_87995 [Volvox carteri f. nagariensis]EFJ51181.1 hypothetical protein VOLCADRAFT_87995 [Volvox carteri f. nagariensis]|eukprot:XP_002947648.1 hypothetical protein VOLCADRAFT_87995 [Volvox carteri f. nagariensis]
MDLIAAALRANLPYAVTLEDGLRELLRRTLGSVEVGAAAAATAGPPTDLRSVDAGDAEMHKEDSESESDLDSDLDLGLGRDTATATGLSMEGSGGDSGGGRAGRRGRRGGGGSSGGARRPRQRQRNGGGGGGGGGVAEIALLAGDPVQTSVFVQGLSRLLAMQWLSRRRGPETRGQLLVEGGGGGGVGAGGGLGGGSGAGPSLELLSEPPPSAGSFCRELLGLIMPLRNEREEEEEAGTAASVKEGGEDEAAAGTTAGTTFYDNFKAVVNRAVLFDPEVSVCHILRALAARERTAAAAGSAAAAAAAVSTTAEAVLAGVCESLLRSRAAVAAVARARPAAAALGGPPPPPLPPLPPPSALDLHLSAFMASCRRHLHLLQPLARKGAGSSGSSGPSLESQLLLLRVLRLLLQLDAAGLLQPGPSLDFILDCYCEALAPSAAAASAGALTQALQLLPALAAGLPDGGPLERLFGGGAAASGGAPGVVISLVPYVCPTNSRRDHPDPTAPAAVDMSMRLHALMETLVQLSYAAAAAAEVATAAAGGGGGGSGGSRGGAARAAAAASLLKALLIVVQDMGGPTGHLLQTRLVRMFVQMAAAAWHGAPSVTEDAAKDVTNPYALSAAAAAAARAWPGDALLSYSFSWLLLDPGFRGMREMRLALLHHVVMPLLAAAPAPYRVEWYGTYVRRMVHHVQDTAGGGGGAGGGAGPGTSQLLNSWVCYTLLQAMYGMCTAQEIDRIWDKSNRDIRAPTPPMSEAGPYAAAAAAATSTTAAAGVGVGVGVGGGEVLKNSTLMGLCKRELCRPLPAPRGALNAHELQYQDIDRAVRCAAWAASAALLLRTQNRATFFAKLLRMPDDRNGDPAFVWKRLLPDKAHFRFAADPEDQQQQQQQEEEGAAGAEGEGVGLGVGAPPSRLRSSEPNRRQRARWDQEVVRTAFREMRRQREEELAVRRGGGGGGGGPSASMLMGGTLLGVGGGSGGEDDVASLTAKVSASQYDFGLGLGVSSGTASLDSGGGGGGMAASLLSSGGGGGSGTVAAAALAYTWTASGGGGGGGGPLVGDVFARPAAENSAPGAAGEAAAGSATAGGGVGDEGVDGDLIDDNPMNDELPYVDDEMDEHVCMLPLVQLIEKFSDPATWDSVAEAGAIATAKEAAAAGAAAAGVAAAASSALPGPDAPMPRWLSTLLEALSRTDTPRYIRLFLLKAVLHVEERVRQRKIRIQSQSLQVQSEQLNQQTEQTERPMSPLGMQYSGIATTISSSSRSSRVEEGSQQTTVRKESCTGDGGNGDGDGGHGGAYGFSKGGRQGGGPGVVGTGAGEEGEQEEEGGGASAVAAETRVSELPASDTVFAIWAVRFFPALADAEAAEAEAEAEAVPLSSPPQQQPLAGAAEAAAIGDDDDGDGGEEPLLGQRPPVEAAAAAGGTGGVASSTAAGGSGSGAVFSYVLRSMCQTFMSWRGLGDLGDTEGETQSQTTATATATTTKALLRGAAEQLLRRVVRLCLSPRTPLELCRLNAHHVMALMYFWRRSGVKLRGPELLTLLSPRLETKQRVEGLRVVRAALGYGQEHAVLYGEARDQLWRALRALLSGSPPPASSAAAASKRNHRAAANPSSTHTPPPPPPPPPPALRIVAGPLGELLGLYLAKLAEKEEEGKEGNAVTAGVTGAGDGGGGGGGQEGGGGEGGDVWEVGELAGSGGLALGRQRRTSFGSLLEQRQYDIQDGLRRRVGGGGGGGGSTRHWDALVVVLRGMTAPSPLGYPPSVRHLVGEVVRGLGLGLVGTAREVACEAAFEVLGRYVPLANPTQRQELFIELVTALDRLPLRTMRPETQRGALKLMQALAESARLDDLNCLLRNLTSSRGLASGPSPTRLAMLQLSPALSAAAAAAARNPAAPAAIATSPSSLVSEAASRLLIRWPNVACALLLEPSLALTDNDQPLYTSQPYECTFRDYTPSLGLLYGGGVGGTTALGMYGGGTAAAAALRTPAFLLTQDMYGSYTGAAAAAAARRRPLGLLRATATAHFVPTVTLSVTGDVFAASGGVALDSTYGTGTASQSTAVAAGAPTQSVAAALPPSYGGNRTVRLAARRQQSGSRYARTAAIRGLQQRELSLRAARHEGRASRVRLFRSYRTGELPDTLSVRVASFLRPLAGVVEVDGPAATAALAAIVEAVAAAAAAAAAPVGPQQRRELLDALAVAFAARPAAPSYVTALQAMAARLIDAGGAAVAAPLLLLPADLTAAAAASGGYQAAAVLLEAQQAVQERELDTAKAAANASSSGSGRYSTAIVKRASAGLSATLEAVAHVYGELDEQDIVLGTRRRLCLCPGSFAMLAAEAAGRPRLAVRRAGQLTAALDLLTATVTEAAAAETAETKQGPGVASKLVPERPQDRGVALGSSAVEPLLPPPQEGADGAGGSSGGGCGGGGDGAAATSTVAALLGEAVMARAGGGEAGGGGDGGGTAAAAAVCSRLVAPAEAALWRETVAVCADALGDWSLLEGELQRSLVKLGVTLPGGGEGGGGGGGSSGGLYSSSSAVTAVAEALPRSLLLSGAGPSGGSSGGGGAGLVLRRVLRSALFQLSEDDFQLAAAAAAAAEGRGDGAAGAGTAGVAATAGSAPSTDGPALLVLRLLEQLDHGGSGGGGGGGREAASCAAAAVPLELVAAEVFRACRRGSWERCLTVLQASLAGLRCRWTGLHPLSTAARTATLTVLQPLAEIHEMIRQLVHAGGGGVSGGVGRGRDGVVVTPASSAVRHLETLVEVWRRRGLGGATVGVARVATATATGTRPGGGGNGGPSGTGSALGTLLQVRRLSLEAAANCILPRAVLAGAAGVGGANSASCRGQLQLAARAAQASLRFAAAEAAVQAGCADTAAEALPPPLLALAQSPPQQPQQPQQEPQQQLRLFRAHIDTAAAQAAAEPADACVYGAVSELLSTMRPWHREAVRTGILGGRLAAESELAQSQALLVLSGRHLPFLVLGVAVVRGDPDPTVRQQYLAVRLATALCHAATATAYQPPNHNVLQPPRPQIHDGHHDGQSAVAAGLSVMTEAAEEAAAAAAAVSTAARASAHFALLCGRLLRATHESATERALDPTMSSLEELYGTAKRKQVAAAVRTGGGDLSACVVRHLLRAVALAGSGTAGCYGGGEDNGVGGKGSEERLQTLAAHLRLQVPVVLSVLRDSAAAAEAFRQGWTAVPLGVFLPWVSQMTSMSVDSWCYIAFTTLRESPPWQVFSGRITQALARGDVDAAVEVWSSEAWPNLFSRYHRPHHQHQHYQTGLPAAAAATPRPPVSRRQVAGAAPPAEPYNVAFARRYRAAFEEAFGGSGNARAGGLGQWEGLQAAGLRSLDLLSPWFRSYEQVAADANASMLSSSHPFSSSTGLARQGRRKQQMLLLLPSMAFATATSPPPAEPGAYGSRCSGGGLPPLGLQDDAGAVAVVGFKRVVTVFSSKQRPKLLTLYCSDLSTREFVVKGGEDVRLDERIQQLYDAMNGVTAHDAACARRSLRVPVYDVIPLSPTVGLLQFVPGTRPLQSCLVDNPERAEQEAQAIELYANYIRSAAASTVQPRQQHQAHAAPGLAAPGQLPGPRDYWQMYIQADSASTVRHFKQAVGCLPAGLLRSFLLRVSGHSPELFLARRGALVSGLVAGSVFGYLAGVGDRHTSNLLLQPATGRLVHIDFGYSLGAATQVVPIPELVPFRLTPQLLGALQPHCGKEVMVPGMAAALAALSAPPARQLLAAVMEVFLREPVADWQQEAMMLRTSRAGEVGGGGSQDGGEEEDDSRVLAARLARNRHLPLCGGSFAVYGMLSLWSGGVETALQKLARRHPSLILVEDLRGRHGAAPYFQALCDIVQGASGGSGGSSGGGPTAFRARPELLQHSGPLPPVALARCLVDLATDTNVLGRMYLGWRPYL